MLFSEMQTELGSVLSDADHATWSLTEKKALINLALRALVHELYKRTDFGLKSATITTVSGTQKYDLPSDFFACRRAYINNDIDINLGNRQPGYTDEKGQPIKGWIEGAYKIVAGVTTYAEIGFWPTPDGVYSVAVDYLPAIDALSADGDQCPIPVDFHDVVIQDAAIAAYVRRGHRAQARTLFDEGQSRKNQMIEECCRRYRGQGSIFVNCMGGDLDLE
jgi:hypothetical protein